MPLAPEKLQLLRTAYLDGSTIGETARLAKVSPQTVWRKFVAMRAEGLPRGKRPSKAKRDGRRNTRWGAPRYTGPDWIG